MVSCKECNREFESLDSLRRHRTQKHGVNAEQTYIDYILNGIKPTCKCGCGEKPKYLGIDAGYRDYIRGHAARVNNNWGHNPDAIKKSHETQKKMHDSGELNVWNKGLTIERDLWRKGCSSFSRQDEWQKKTAMWQVTNTKTTMTGLPKNTISKWEMKFSLTINSS